MKIQNEMHLRSSYEWIARMYALRDQIAADSTGHAGTRQAEVDGVDAMIRKIERQIAEYYSTHPERFTRSTAQASAPYIQESTVNSECNADRLETIETH